MVTCSRFPGGRGQNNQECGWGQSFLDYVLIGRQFTLHSFISIEVNISANLSPTPHWHVTLSIPPDGLFKNIQTYSFISDSLPKIKKLCVFGGPAMEWNLLEVNLFILFNFVGSSVIPLWEHLTLRRDAKQERRMWFFNLIYSPPFPSLVEFYLYCRDWVLSSSTFSLIK